MQVFQVLFISDGRLASCGSESAIKIWKAPVPTGLPTLQQEAAVYGDELVHARFSPDSRTIATAGFDQPRTCRLWRAKTGDFVAALTNCTSLSGAAAFSADSRLFATGDSDTGVYLWDTRDGRLLKSLDTGTNPVVAVAFSGEGHLFAAAGADEFIRRWDVATFDELAPLTGYDSGVKELRIAPHSKLLAAWCPDGNIRLNDLQTLEPLTPIPHRSDSARMEFSPDSKLLLVQSPVGAELWEMRPTNKLRVFGGALWPVFSPDGRLLAIQGGVWPPGIDIWDIGKQRTVARLPLDGAWAGSAHGVVFSSDGRTLVSSDSWLTLRFWSMTTFRQVLALTPKGGCGYPYLSPDGNTLLILNTVRENLLLHAPALPQIDAEIATQNTSVQAPTQRAKAGL
jgi:WD40 repeat protein